VREGNIEKIKNENKKEKKFPLPSPPPSHPTPPKPTQQMILIANHHTFDNTKPSLSSV
jgi:hypothetical protein